MEGQASLKRGGAKGQAATIPGTRDREAGPPRAIGYFGYFRNLMPDPGRVFNDAEASDDKGPREQQEPAAREDREDFRYRRA